MEQRTLKLITLAELDSDSPGNVRLRKHSSQFRVYAKSVKWLVFIQRQLGDRIMGWFRSVGCAFG